MATVSAPATNGRYNPPPVPAAVPPPVPVPPPVRLPTPAVAADALRIQLELSLYRLIHTLPPACPLDPVTVRVQMRDGTVWTLRGSPPGHEPEPEPGRAPLCGRERKVLEAVRVEIERHNGRRVIGRDILAALHAAGYRLGRSTLNEILSDLVHRGHLVNPKDKLGYGFPEEEDPRCIWPGGSEPKT